MRTKHLLSLLTLLLFALASAAQSSGQLLVFVDSSKPVSKHFTAESLPMVKAMAAERNLEVQVIEIAEGAPKEVTFTPQIVFQNHLGRSLYRGRYTTIERLTNFVRTVTNAPQANANNPKVNTPVIQTGRAVVGTPIKITPLSGTVPVGFDQEIFQEEALEVIGTGLQTLRLVEQYNFPASGRLLYVDFHPFLGQDGSLFISAKIFSMFSCVEPVYETPVPYKGTWDTRRELFKTAGKGMEYMALQQLRSLAHGDAIEQRPFDQPTPSWTDLGLELPAAPKVSLPPAFTNNSLSKEWTFAEGLPDGSPLVQFHFGAPVDHYAGEARQMRTQLRLKSKNSLQGATGHVVVKTSSITMGDDGLDDHIFNDYLAVLNYPNATYEFEIVEAPASWEIGSSQSIGLKGTFSMIGKPVELSSSGRVDVVSGNNGEPLLKLHGSFKLPLKALYGIEGPDGPSPAKDELQFYLNVLLKPTKKAAKLSSELFAADTPKANSKEPLETEGDFIGWKARNKFYKANGSFKKWEVAGYKMQGLDVSTLKVIVVIDITSMEEKSKKLVHHLQQPDFFDAEQFPTGTIRMKNPVPDGNGGYTAQGEATLLGIAKQIPISFEVVSETPFVVSGTAIINRNAFGIGKMKSAKGITEDVEVKFRLTAPE